VLHDVAIVGGGPAGLALAIQCASRGLSTVVLERRSFPCDKACGEGLMPAGARSLERLGVRALLSDDDCTAFEGIRYVQEDGTTATARLAGGGLGVRRVALSDALARRARAVGASVREGTALKSHARTRSGFQLATDAGPLDARLLVAADGLSSALRRSEGLERVVRGPRRFGMRRHFRCSPWSSFVEVHFAEHAEAYVTPVGRRRVGIAFLWEDGRLPAPISYQALLALFPKLLDRVRGMESDSQVSGAGPFERGARRQVTDQFVLFGDAAGYVDALTGEGLSLAFHCAEVLGEALPGALAAGAARGTLLPYQRAYRRAFRKYAWLTRGMLMIVRRPALRRPIVRWLGAHQRLFERLVRWAT
jgi:flavin-dependent dehydrogenase